MAKVADALERMRLTEQNTTIQSIRILHDHKQLIVTLIRPGYEPVEVTWGEKGFVNITRPEQSPES